MKPYLIFVAVLANFCSHGVSGGTLPEEYQKPSFFENVNTMDGKDQEGSPRFLPGLPGGQPVSQPSTTSYSPPQTNYQKGYPTKNTGYQPPSVQGYPSGPTYPGPSTPPAVVPSPVPNVPVPVTETPVTMTCRFTVENSLANQRVTCINKMVDGQSCSYDQDDNECKCPTKKDECPNKSQCTWHAGQCIHKTEKIYLGLDARLKMRGKTDLALQIFYNKKPARISAPYGQFGYFQVDAFKNHRTYPHIRGGTYGSPSYGNGYYGMRHYGNYGKRYGGGYGSYGGYDNGYKSYDRDYGYDSSDKYEYGYKGGYDSEYQDDHGYKGGYEPEYKSDYEQEYKDDYGYKGGYEPEYKQDYGYKGGYEPEYNHGYGYKGGYEPEYKNDYGYKGGYEHEYKYDYGYKGGYEPEYKQDYGYKYEREYY